MVDGKKSRDIEIPRVTGDVEFFLKTGNCSFRILCDHGWSLGETRYLYDWISPDQDAGGKGLETNPPDLGVRLGRTLVRCLWTA